MITIEYLFFTLLLISPGAIFSGLKPTGEYVSLIGPTQKIKTEKVPGFKQGT